MLGLLIDYVDVLDLFDGGCFIEPIATVENLQLRKSIADFHVVEEVTNQLELRSDSMDTSPK